MADLRSSRLKQRCSRQSVASRRERISRVYGLPLNHEGPVNDWDELRRYLESIAESGVAVRVSVGPSANDPYLEARAKLRPDDGERDAGHAVFVLNTDSSREEGGLISYGETISGEQTCSPMTATTTSIS
jgi:hypothetical protein